MEIILIIVAFGLIPTISLGLFYYRKINDLLRERLTASATEVVRQAGDTIEAILRETEAVRTLVIMKANASEELLTGAVPATGQPARAARELNEFLQNLRLSIRYLSNIYLVGANGVVYSSAFIFDSSALLAKPWVRGLLDFTKPREVFHLHRVDYDANIYTHPFVLSFGVRIARRRDPRHIVRIVIDISSDELAASLRWANLGKSGALLLTDKDGIVLSSGRKDHVGCDVRSLFGDCAYDPAGASEGSTRECGDNLIIQRGIGSAGWLLGVVPLAAFYGEFTKVRNLFMLLTLGFAALTFLLSVALAHRITRPLQRLSMAMRAIQDGDFSVHLRESGTREIASLTRSFNAMGSEIKSLLRKLSLKERESLRAELLALRLQINPHFLYNTLDVMRGIAHAHGAGEAAEIARSLSALLRYSMVQGADIVPLSEELASLRHYLGIQKRRFDGRFSTRIRVDIDAEGTKVPRFVLQPIVENVFQHAVERSVAPVSIRISVREDGQDLLVEVSDDGPGLEEQEVGSIVRSLRDGLESKNSGIGLLNVHNRIRLAYGEGYGLAFASAKGRGTEVRMRIPLKARRYGKK